MHKSYHVFEVSLPIHEAALFSALKSVGCAATELCPVEKMTNADGKEINVVYLVGCNCGQPQTQKT